MSSFRCPSSVPALPLPSSSCPPPAPEGHSAHTLRTRYSHGFVTAWSSQLPLCQARGQPHGPGEVPQTRWPACPVCISLLLPSPPPPSLLCPHLSVLRVSTHRQFWHALLPPPPGRLPVSRLVPLDPHAHGHGEMMLHIILSPLCLTTAPPAPSTHPEGWNPPASSCHWPFTSHPPSHYWTPILTPGGGCRVLGPNSPKESTSWGAWGSAFWEVTETAVLFPALGCGRRALWFPV